MRQTKFSRAFDNTRTLIIHEYSRGLNLGLPNTSQMILSLNHQEIGAENNITTSVVKSPQVIYKRGRSTCISTTNVLPI